MYGPLPTETHPTDVPAYTIVGGNPAIRPRFPVETNTALEALAWWDWPIEEVARNLELIVAGDVDALRRAYCG